MMTNFRNLFVVILASASTIGPTIGTGVARLALTADDKCPKNVPTKNWDFLTQEEFIDKLTDPCRYDKLIKPVTSDPLPIYVQIELNHVETSQQVEFNAHMVVQYEYNDNRLRYDVISPNRGIILGEQPLRDKIWIPHMIIRNEKETTIMGVDGKDVFVMISPNGDVVYSSRMVATFYCWMDLKKFPFDTQNCYLRWNSWTYNITNLVLHWDKPTPVLVSPNLHLTEFVMTSKSTEERVVPAAFTKGALVGNFSELVFKFTLTREVGYYIMDYFLPSVLLVCTSWVTFWLQADAGPPRATLGTSTVLAFITLNGGLSKDLPKVSYVKASDIWFLACSLFIFGSLAEFAFVNVIWRRKKKVELKKQNTKYMIKGAFTPSWAREELRKAESLNSLYKPKSFDDNSVKLDPHYLTVHGYPNMAASIQSQEDNGSTVTVEASEESPEMTKWTEMSPQDVAIWIDRKSRIVFPVAFIIFNLLYWGFVYIL